MLETLVLLACFSSTGCAEAGTAYYIGSKELQDSLAYTQAKIVQKVGKEVAQVGASSLLLLSGRPWHYKIKEHLVTNGDIIMLKGEKVCNLVSLSYSLSF